MLEEPLVQVASECCTCELVPSTLAPVKENSTLAKPLQGSKWPKDDDQMNENDTRVVFGIIIIIVFGLH